MSDKAKTKDDLTKIKGIGKSYAKWLEATLSIDSFATLAASSAAKLAVRAKEAGKIISGEVIDAWIKQAGELAKQKASPEKIVLPQKQPKQAPRKRTVALVASAKRNRIAEEGQWDTLATFVVEFQQQVDGAAAPRRTYANYHDYDLCQTWPGIDTTRLGAWMEEKAAAKLNRPLPQAGIPTQTASAMILTPQHIHLSQANGFLAKIDATLVKETPLKTIEHQHLLSLAVSFGNSQDVDSDQFEAQCFIDEMTRLSPPRERAMKLSKVEGAARLFEASLDNLRLEPGMYQFAVLIRGRKGRTATYLELPKLNVL